MYNKDRPVAIMLIGVPGSGKTTYYEQYLQRENAKRISSDDYIEQYAATVGKTYGEVFGEVSKIAMKWMEDQLNNAIETAQNIIWDQTNLSMKSRHSKLRILNQAGYAVHAISFEIPTEELERRRHEREVKTGKTISRSVLESMGKTYQRPTMMEGFSKVTIITPEGEYEV